MQFYFQRQIELSTTQFTDPHILCIIRVFFFFFSLKFALRIRCVRALAGSREMANEMLCCFPKDDLAEQALLKLNHAPFSPFKPEQLNSWPYHLMLVGNWAPGAMRSDTDTDLVVSFLMHVVAPDVLGDCASDIAPREHSPPSGSTFTSFSTMQAGGASYTSMGAPAAGSSASSSSSSSNATLRVESGTSGSPSLAFDCAPHVKRTVDVPCACLVRSLFLDVIAETSDPSDPYHPNPAWVAQGLEQGWRKVLRTVLMAPVAAIKTTNTIVSFVDELRRQTGASFTESDTKRWQPNLFARLDQSASPLETGMLDASRAGDGALVTGYEVYPGFSIVHHTLPHKRTLVLHLPHPHKIPMETEVMNIFCSICFIICALLFDC